MGLQIAVNAKISVSNRRFNFAPAIDYVLIASLCSADISAFQRCKGPFDYIQKIAGYLFTVRYFALFFVILHILIDLLGEEG
ncbi:hypothetical protein D3C80_1229260 [compost metagenome]